jgi:hypothetical protein
MDSSRPDSDSLHLLNWIQVHYLIWARVVGSTEIIFHQDNPAFQLGCYLEIHFLSGLSIGIDSGKADATLPIAFDRKWTQFSKATLGFDSSSLTSGQVNPKCSAI